MTQPYRISDLLPQAGRLRLLDELLDFGEEHVVCGVTVRGDSLFCDGVHGVPAWVGLEYMAQTMCAYSGIEEVRGGCKPSIGLLLGTRRYETSQQWFTLGASLAIRADLKLRDDNDLVAFQCTIHEDGRLIAQGDVKALRPKDVRAVLAGETQR